MAERRMICVSMKKISGSTVHFLFSLSLHTHTCTHTHTHSYITHIFSECLFLRYRKAVRCCPMPSPITLSTIKNLFVNMFDLSPSLLNGPSCSLYVQDKASQQWKPLDSMRYGVQCISVCVWEREGRERERQRERQRQRDRERERQRGDEGAQGVRNKQKKYG